MKVEQIIMLVIAFLLGYQFKNICGQKVVEGVTFDFDTYIIDSLPIPKGWFS